MAGRRVKPPGSVDVLSLASTGHAPTDRVLQQAQEAVQDLQAQARETVGELAALPGRLLGARLLTGAGAYTPTPGTRMVLVRMVGGGGGGGGGTGGSGTASGSGGASGTYLEFHVSGDGRDLAGGPYSCGAGGAGGSTAGSAGGAGGDTTLQLHGQTYRATGGGGGGGQVNTTSGHAPPVGRRRAGSTPMPVTLGEDGDHGVFAPSDGYFWGGAGGSNPLGTGGATVDGGNNGTAPTGFGGGGGGASATTASKSGGAGAPGCIALEEYA